MAHLDVISCRSKICRLWTIDRRIWFRPSPIRGARSSQAQGLRGSAMELFEFADVEDLAHLLEVRGWVAGSEIGKNRGALIDVVGGRDALDLGRVHAMIDLGPFLVILGPAPRVDD